jgi:hypothetical protein
MDRAIGRILATATAEHDWARSPEGLAELLKECGDLRELAFAAAYHGVAGCVHLSVRGSALVPADVLADLESWYRSGVSAHLRATADLTHVARTLDGCGVPWLVVKGPVLAGAVYSRPDLRSYKDLDLVVPSQAFPAVVHALEESGFPVLDRNWRLVREQLRGQLHLRLRLGTHADLHWHLVNQHRHRFTVPMEGLLRRRRRVRVGALDLWTLDPVDTLLHVAFHASLSGGDRLVWAKDIEQAVLQGPVDWDAVVRRALQWRAALPVGAMLLRSASVLGAPVPGGVVRALVPSRIRRTLQRTIDRVQPPGALLGEPSITRLLSLHTGLGARLALAEGARRVGLRVRRVGDRAATTNPLLADAGDHADRQRYLAEVAGFRSAPAARRRERPRSDSGNARSGAGRR